MEAGFLSVSKKSKNSYCLIYVKKKKTEETAFEHLFAKVAHI